MNYPRMFVHPWCQRLELQFIQYLLLQRKNIQVGRGYATMLIFVDQDVLYRGAISIALRLVDPLCELVKVPPPSIGVGMYQHDIKEKVLEQRLGSILEEVVSEIGVDVNSASKHVLSYVSGINKSQAASIIQHRIAHGPFRSREEIMGVKGVGRVSFQNAAGFLRVMNGEEPLDSTILHPEKYSLMKSLLGLVFASKSSPDSRSKKRKMNSIPHLSNQEIANLLFTSRLRDGLIHCNWDDLKNHLNEDVESLKLYAKWISDPYYSSTDEMDLRGRKGIPPFLSKKCLLSPNEYQPGLLVRGVVRNITSFGTFIDIGAEEDGFLHRSKYGSRSAGGFVIGEQLQCRVLLIDAERGGKISLELVDSHDNSVELGTTPQPTQEEQEISLSQTTENVKSPSKDKKRQKRK